MSTDIESMLRLAAKAGGISVIRSRLEDPMNRDFLVSGSARNVQGSLGAWNPLTDDGDNARLRRAVRIVVQWFPKDVAAMHWGGDGRGRSWAEPYGTDPGAAERLAVVRAAAAIAKDLP